MGSLSKPKVITERLTTAITVHDREIKTMSFEWNINVSPSLMKCFAINKPVDVGKFQFLKMDDQFMIYGSGVIHSPSLNITMYLPQRVDNMTVCMKPFTVECMSKGQVSKSILWEFPATALFKIGVGTSSMYFSDKVNIPCSGPEGVDVDALRVTFEFELEKAATSTIAAVGNTTTAYSASMLNPGLANNATLKIREFYNSGILSDIVIFCGGKEFPAHRIALASASPIFLQMFQSDVKENHDGRLVIEDMEKEIVDLMLQWIYTGEVKVDDFVTLVGLFKAGHKYCVNLLKDLCASQIAARHTNMDTAIEVFGMGMTYEEVVLLEPAKQMLKLNREAIFKTEELFQKFVNMYPQHAFELFVR